MDVFDLYAKISLDPSEFERGLNQAKTKAETFAKNVSGLSSNISGVYSGVKDVLSPAVDGFKAVESVGKTAGNAVMNGLKGFAAAATAVGGFGTAAVKSGMAFDATMSKVAATVGWTTDELHDQTSDASQDFSKLRDKALEMGAKTQFSASEAADALTYMAMAGWKTDDMLGGIKGIMDLAAASGEDLASTSDIVTDALTAFGMAASESGHFADILAKASSNSNTNVGMMGETFKYVAPVAGAMGFTAEDTALAIGLMANSGIKASQAGTALRTTLTNMAKPTDSMAHAMDVLGISLDDGEGHTKSLKDVMDDLRSGFGNLMIPQSEFQERLSKLNAELESGKIKQKKYNTEIEELIGLAYGAEGAEKAQFAAMLAGKEAMSGLLAIVSAAPEDYEKLTAAIYECDGAAEKMAATMMDNLAGDMKLVSSAFESLQIAISDSLTSTLREFAQFGQKAMENLLEGFQGSGVSGFMSALSKIVTDGVTMLAQKAPEFASVSLQFIQALADGLMNASDEIIMAGNSVLFTLIDGVGKWLSENSDRLVEIGYGLVGDIFSAFLDAGDIISDNIGKFIPLIADAFTAYHEALFTVGLDILGAIGQGLVENKDEIQHWISLTIENMVTSLRDNAPMIIEGGLALLEALVGAIEENMPLILATGVEIIGQLVAGIATASPGVQAIIATAVLPHILKIIEVVGDIGGVFKKVVDLVTGGEGIGKILKIGGKLMDGIKLLFGLIAAHPVIAVITTIIAAVTLLWTHCEAFRDGVKAVLEAVGNAVHAAGEKIGGILSAIGEAFHSLGEKIAEIAASIKEAVVNGFTSAFETVKSIWDGATAVFSEIGASILEALSTAADAIGNAFSTAFEVVSGVWSAAIGLFADIWNSIKSAAIETADKIGSALSAAWDATVKAWGIAIDFFGDIAEGIVGVFSGIGSKFLEIGGNIVDGIKNGISNAWSSFMSWLSGKVSGIVDGVKGLLGIHSPSTVFAGIGENMALGLAEGWDDEYSAIKRKIEGGLNFGTATVGLTANGAYNAPGQAQNGPQAGFGGAGNTYVTINSPVSVDAVQAAREWKKTTQRMAMGYV